MKTNSVGSSRKISGAKQLRLLERKLFRMVERLQLLHRQRGEGLAACDLEVNGLEAEVKALWMKTYRLRTNRENAQAAAKDRGEVCWSVFKPDKNSITEVTRTPHRRITQYHWKRGWPEVTHYECTDARVDVTMPISAWSDFRNEMKREAA